MAQLTFNYDQEHRQIEVYFPLTSPTGNVRVRRRTNTANNGYQVKKEEIKDEWCYIDWQIEYDTRNEDLSASGRSFIRTENHETKFLYCLSDFICFCYFEELLPQEALIQTLQDLQNKRTEDFIISNPNLIVRPYRGNMPCPTLSMSGFAFNPFCNAFPVYNVKIDEYIDAEIGIYEGGYATSSLMPHLYLCIPFECLANFNDLNGRPSETNECGVYLVNEHNAYSFLRILHLIGLLTSKHRNDVVDILQAILN